MEPHLSRWIFPLLCLGMLLNAASVDAQHTEALRVLALPDDSAKVQALCDLCFAYRRSNGDSALLFGEKARGLALRIGDRRGEAQAYNDMAIIHMDRSAYDEADSLLQRALLIRTQLADSAGMGAIHNKLGNIKQSRFRLEEALEENHRALAIYERIGPPAHEALILNNIGILQFNLKRYDAALATHRKAAAVRQRIGDGAGLAASQGNMANALLFTGDTLSAVQLLNEGIGYFRRNDMQPEMAVLMHNLAGILRAQGRTAASERLFREALAVRQRSGEPKAITSSMIGLAAVLLDLQRPTEAERLLRQALANSRALGVRSEEMQALNDLARLHSMRGRADSTWFYARLHDALRDSIYGADMRMRVARLEASYESSRKEREILRQRAELAELDRSLAEASRHAEQRKRQLVIALAAGVSLLLAALLVMQVQRRRARATRDAAIIAERENGLRNVLVATDAERKRLAGELHDGVGQQLTGLKFRLEHLAGVIGDSMPQETGNMREILTLAEGTGREVRHIAHSMMPRALEELGLVPALRDMLHTALHGTSIACTFEPYGMALRLPPEVEVGVYRIAQELVGNVIKHAQATRASVQLIRNKGHIVLMVEDDGRGMGSGGRSGIGMRSIADRARVLHGTVEFESMTQKGTLATVRIPIPLSEPAT